MSVIAIPKILRERLSDEGADALVQILDKVEDRSQKAVMEIAEERFEKRLAQLESNLKTEMAGIGASLRTEMANIGASLKAEIATTKASLTRWTFVFIMGEFWALLGILFVFFRR